MSETLNAFTGMVAISTLFLLAGCALVATNRTVDRHARATFLGVLIALGLINLADWATFLTNGMHPELRWVHTVSLALSFALAPPLPILIADVIFPGRLARPLLMAMAFQALLELASIFGGFVFWVDAGNVYHRGPLYPIYMVSYLLSAGYLVAVSLRGSRQYQSANAGVVLLILLCLVGGVSIQIVDPEVRTSWPAVIMAVMLYFQFYTEMVLRTDALTKLLNRHDYDVSLASPSLPCTVVVIDVDDFKHVNDSYGHAFGDECLKTIAGLIMKAFGPVGRCYRTGGDEFTVIGTGAPEEVPARIDMLTSLVDTRRLTEPRLPGVSVGSAVADASCMDLAAVIAAADESMYQSKRDRKERAQRS